jgi:hypothetical protein
MSDLPTRSPSRGKHAWSAKKPQKRTSHRFASLLILGGAFLACISLFMFFLFDNPSKPKTHLLYLQLSNHDSPGVTTIATVDEKDISNFASSLQIEKPVALTALGDQSTEVALRNATTALKLAPQDTLILYLRTQTLVAEKQDTENKDALLITGDFDPKGDLPSISFTDVCTDLCKLPCGKVVILLDHSDLELSSDYALQVRNYSRDYLNAWLKKWTEDTGLSEEMASKLVIVSARSDSQPSHFSFATPTSPAKTLFFYALEKAATEMVSEGVADSSNFDGIPFADFFAKVYRYTKMGSGALQTPVLFAGKQQIDPGQLSSPALAFTLGNFSKSRLDELAKQNSAKDADTEKRNEKGTSNTATAASPPSSEEENASTTEPIVGLSQAWELAEKLQANSAIPPTDFAPHTWHNLLESLCTAELEQRVGTPVTKMKGEVDLKWRELQELSQLLSTFKNSTTTNFNNPWKTFTQDPHFKAWTYDLNKLPDTSPTYPYQPDDDLGYPVTRDLGRTFAQTANQFTDWLLFQHYYPFAGSRLETAVMQYLQTIMVADGDWLKLLAGPTSLPVTERQNARDLLNGAAKQLQTQIKDEIERLESDIEMTRWQIHYRAHRLLQVTSLSLPDRQRLWKLAQRPLKDLPAKEPNTSDLKLSDTMPIGFSTLSAEGFLINSPKKDLSAIVPPTLDQSIQFSADSLGQLTFMRTGSPEEFPIQVQRCDGTTPPDTIEINVQGAAEEQLKLSQAGNSMPWNKPTKVSLNHGRATLNLSALLQASPDLPQQITIQMASIDKAPENAISDVRNSHALKLYWPLSNKFELYASIDDWTPIDLSQGRPLLGAAVKNPEGVPAILSYQLSIHNESQLKRKALVQFYRVGDIGVEVKNPGSNRNRQGETYMSQESALRLLDRWQPLLKQPIELDFPANQTVSLNLPSTSPNGGADNDSDKKTTPSEPSWLAVPNGLFCTVTELDQDRRPKSTDVCWISFDTIDPIDTQYKWLKDTNLFRYDNQRKKLYFSANPTDVTTRIPGVDNIPIQIEIQSLGQSTINSPLEVEPLSNRPVERELPLGDLAEKPFLVHLSLGTFPRQATFSFADAQSDDPQREPELTAFLGTPSIASPTPSPNQQGSDPSELKGILLRLPPKAGDTTQRWVIDNTTDLTNTNLLVDIDAVFPFLQSYVGYTIRNTTSYDLKKNEFFYEPINRRFEVRVSPEGKLDVQHQVDKWQINTAAKSLFEEEGEYRIDLYRGSWTEMRAVSLDQLTTATDSRIIICDKTPPAPLSNGIFVKDEKGKNIFRGTNLQRDKKYTIEITPIDEGPGNRGVGIKEVVFGFDKDDDQKLSDKEIDPKIVPQRNGERWTAEIKVEQDSLRIVARTIDYANNSQDFNCSERFQVSKTKSTEQETGNSPTAKLYNLTIDVRLATTGDPPSKPVELQLEGRSVSSQPDSHTFQFEKIPTGSYKASARTTLGFDVYEIEESIEVSGKETSISRQLKLQKKKPPMP